MEALLTAKPSVPPNSEAAWVKTTTAVDPKDGGLGSEGLGPSTHPGLQDQCGGDPRLAGDPGAVGHVVAQQFGDQRAEVHV